MWCIKTLLKRWKGWISFNIRACVCVMWRCLTMIAPTQWTMHVYPPIRCNSALLSAHFLLISTTHTCEVHGKSFHESFFVFFFLFDANEWFLKIAAELVWKICVEKSVGNVTIRLLESWPMEKMNSIFVYSTLIN